MNRIAELFLKKNQNILSVYFTAGFPALNDTLRTIKELDNNGVDMIEIGMPFSDPLADGPVIQKSSQKALINGMNTKLLFEQLKSAREFTNIPLILMGYFNPVYRFGVHNFISKCKETGIDGVIIPDFPVEEYLESYQDVFEKYDIYNIFLISPQTPSERITYLDNLAKGFLYMVSTAATTGAINEFSHDQLDYFNKVKDLRCKTPRLIGFGVSNHLTFTQANTYADGVIIGSAFIKAISDDGRLSENVKRFISNIRG